MSENLNTSKNRDSQIVQTLAAQRNEALNMVAHLTGEIRLLQDRIIELEAMVAKANESTD